PGGGGAGDRGVPPEAGGGRGVAEGAAQAVVDGGETAAGMASRSSTVSPGAGYSSGGSVTRRPASVGT
ncbi:hypothetical protein ABTX35_39650, partial [Streptomyces sp. NPDC096080]